MNDLELRMNFLERQGQKAIALDGQKIQAFAGLVVTFDELAGLIESRQHLNSLQKFRLKTRLDDLMNNSFRVF